MFGFFAFHHSAWLVLASDLSLSFLPMDLISSLQIKCSNWIGVESGFWICFLVLVAPLNWRSTL